MAASAAAGATPVMTGALRALVAAAAPLDSGLSVRD